MAKKPTIENLTSSDFEQRITKPKILLFDLETSPAYGAVWQSYETNVLWVTQYPQIICFSAKWLDGKQITKAQPDYDGYEAGKLDDAALVRELYVLMKQADIVVAQNGDSFDVRVAKTRFLFHDLPPLYVMSVDTKKTARREFRMFNNKLDTIGDFLGLGHKQEHEGLALWRKCIERGDLKAWNRMKRYCAQDVKLLQSVYLKTCKWDRTHPNYNVLLNREDGCTKCGSKDITKDGFQVTRTGRRQQYECNDCGGKSFGPHIMTTRIR